MKKHGFISKESSRVGRRIVVSFLLFAVIPLLIFAYQSHSTVSKELRKSAEDRLRRDVKSVGVTILERLVVAVQLLRHLEVNPILEKSEARKSLIDDRSIFVGLLDFQPEPKMKDALLRDVKKLGVVLHFNPDDPLARVWLLTAGLEENELLAARVSDDFLFRPEGLERPPSRFAVYSPEGRQIHAQVEDLKLTELTLRTVQHHTQGSFSWTDQDGDKRQGACWRVFASPQFGSDFIVSVHDSEAAILGPLSTFRIDFLRIIALTVAAVVLASLIRIRKIMNPIGQLVEATKRIGRREVGVRLETGAADEFGSLASAFNEMATTLERRAEVINAVNEFGSSLAKETSPRSLVRKLMRGAALMLEVDGVVVYVRNNEDRLDLDHLRIRSLDIELERDQNGSCALYSLPRESLSIEVERIDDLRTSKHELASILRGFTSTRDYVLRDALVVPMLDHEGEVIGALAVFNSEKGGLNDATLDGDSAELACSLASQASLGIANARLREEFKNLFDAMIEVLAVAVDEKSPYTGGHCRRVPKIALMLFDQVRAASTGAYAATTFSADEAYEMQVAALLHDCGKVVTPVHVVDKATKLETIFDRIQTVSERMDLVAALRERDALRNLAAGGEVDFTAHDGAMEELRRRLVDDRDFLKRSNVGGEFMRDEDVARVDAMSKFWSYENGDGELRELLLPDEKLNLAIRKGTLNDEERKIINYHMDATIMMLDQLPFPARLKNVSLIAGSHHERMDGKGFPRGLDATNIPLQGRMLAIADVFEALTAIDRPYKKGMGLAQSLKIMAFMARDGHLDPTLFAFFLRSDVWQRYADEILTPEQLDEVDVEGLLSHFQGEVLMKV